MLQWGRQACSHLCISGLQSELLQRKRCSQVDRPAHICACLDCIISSRGCWTLVSVPRQHYRQHHWAKVMAVFASEGWALSWGCGVRAWCTCCEIHYTVSWIWQVVLLSFPPSSLITHGCNKFGHAVFSFCQTPFHARLPENRMSVKRKCWYVSLGKWKSVVWGSVLDVRNWHFCSCNVIKKFFFFFNAPKFKYFLGFVVVFVPHLFHLSSSYAFVFFLHSILVTRQCQTK